MPQIFKRRSNVLVRAILLGAVLFLGALIYTVYAVLWSPYVTQVGIPLAQPVQFSHEHHYSGLGIDCRYCHVSAEVSYYGGIPPTETCMTCHSQVWTGAPMLAPVRESWYTQTPLQWNRVNDLPNFVYFNHSIHVNKGIGCSTCHGRMDQMELTYKATTQYMAWCLECHRNPEQFIRSREEIYNMAWTPPPHQLQRGAELVRSYHLATNQLANCSVCHH